MITEDELEEFVDYVLIGIDLADGNDMTDKIRNTITDEEMAEKIRITHE